ncbi:DUF2064 domain-containing protein, partial [Bacteriovoracaceae bacterium]|nr:DUF2064 domain-containing protein [Bacteriovoracaceae bacterium]
MNNKRTLYILFSKTPYQDKVKTRLAKVIGEEQATKVFVNSLSLTLTQLPSFDDQYRFLQISLYSSDQIKYWNQFSTFIQPDSPDLGFRIGQTILANKRNYDQIIILGGDCPLITTDIYLEAEEALNENDMVWGPAKDGGFYLCGFLTKIGEDLFHNIEYSSSQTLLQLLEKVKQRNISYDLLTTCSDLDTY